jgi:hypothetical protein
MKNVARTLLPVTSLCLGLLGSGCVGDDQRADEVDAPAETSRGSAPGGAAGTREGSPITAAALIEDCEARTLAACLTVQADPATCDWLVPSVCGTPLPEDECEARVTAAGACWTTLITDELSALVCGDEPPPPPPASTPIADCYLRVAEACDAAVPEEIDGGWLCNAAAQQACPDWAPPVREEACAWDVTVALQWFGLTEEQIAAIAAGTCAPWEPAPAIGDCEARVTAACLAEFPDAAETCAQLGTATCDREPTEASCDRLVLDTCTSFCWSAEPCAEIADAACAEPCAPPASI